jgi:hypothetical protein
MPTATLDVLLLAKADLREAYKCYLHIASHGKASFLLSIAGILGLGSMTGIGGHKQFVRLSPFKLFRAPLGR